MPTSASNHVQINSFPSTLKKKQQIAREAKQSFTVMVEDDE